MHSLSLIFTHLQAAVAARAARDPRLTVLLVAVWGRISRMRARLERLVALWRAGNLPVPRAPRVGPARNAVRPKSVFPNGAGWLRAQVLEVGAYGTQLQHMLSDAECAAFLAAVPQAGRILRPLFHMLGVSPTPEPVCRKLPPPVMVGAAMALEEGVFMITVAPGRNSLPG